MCGWSPAFIILPRQIKTVGLGESSIHWSYADKIEGTSSSGKTNVLLGPSLLVVSALVWAVWYIIQLRIMISDFSHYLLTYYINCHCSGSLYYKSLMMYILVLPFQADMSRNFPAPYTSTNYMCFLASIRCVVLASCFEHRASAWSLHDAMRLASSLDAVLMLLLLL